MRRSCEGLEEYLLPNDGGRGPLKPRDDGTLALVQYAAGIDGHGYVWMDADEELPIPFCPFCGCKLPHEVVG